MTIAAVVILGLLLLAPTRWTLLTQLPTNTRTIIDGAPPPVSITGTPLEHDVEAQIALAIRQDYRSQPSTTNSLPTQWNHLIALQNQRPDQPAILATLLRLQMMSFHDDQSKRSLFTQAATQDHYNPNEPEFLNKLEAEAANGERIAPTNAFFSFMRATILFTMGRDDDALESIKAGGNKTEWNEYLTTEPNGSWKLSDQTAHGPKSIHDLAIESAILFPHYAKLRTAATTAVYTAMLLEENGQTSDALRIRLAVMRLGGLMRSAQAQTAITALVGIAISNIAIERPAGAPMIKVPNGTTDKEGIVRAQRLAAFADYLRRTGHADAIAPVTEEIDKGQQAKHIIGKGLAGNGDLTEFTKFGCWWLAGGVWLQNLIVLCLFVGLGSRLAPRMQGSDARKIGTALGTAIIFGATVPFFVPATINGTFPGDFGNALLATAIATAVLCLCASRCLRNVDGRKSILGLCALVAIVTTIIVWPVSYAFGVQFGNMRDLVSDGVASNSGYTIVPFGLAVSTLLWIGVAIACLVRRVPVVPRATQSFVKSGWIVAFTMLILYAGYAVVMTQWDQRLDRQVRERCGHEIARAAVIAGKTWPAPTDFSAVKL